MAKQTAQLDMNFSVTGVARATGELAKAEKAVRSVQGATAGGLKGLKGALGEESVLGQLGKMARGAGAIAGLAVGAQLLKGWASEAEKFATAFRKGEESVAGMADKLAKSVPVLGQLFEAGRSIREILTGEKFAVDEQNRRTNLIDSASGAAKAASERGARDSAAAEKRIRDIRRGNALFGVDATGAAAVRQAQGAQDSIDVANAAADERAKAISDALRPQRQKLERELSATIVPTAIQEYASGGTGGFGVATGRIANADAIAQAQSERSRIQSQLDLLRKQEADQLAEVARLRQEELDALKEASRQQQFVGGLKAATRMGGNVLAEVGILAQRLRGIDLWKNNGEPAGASPVSSRPAEPEYSVPLAPFAPGGESLARIAAMERAAFGMSEADRKSIALLESIDRRLAQQDDTFR